MADFSEMAGWGLRTVDGVPAWKEVEGFFFWPDEWMYEGRTFSGVQ